MRDEPWIIAEIARRLGHDWGHPSAEDVWNEVRALAPHLRRDELRAARARGRAALALLRRKPSGRANSSTAGSGRSRCAAAGAVLGGGARAAGGATGRGVPAPPHDRPAARLVQHRGADRRLRFAAPARGVARHLAGGRGSAGRHDGDPVRVTRGAAASPRPARIDRSLRAGPRVHDAALPGRGQGQSAHHRRDRSQVGNGGVQGVRRAGGTGAGLGAGHAGAAPGRRARR